MSSLTAKQVFDMMSKYCELGEAKKAVKICAAT